MNNQFSAKFYVCLNSVLILFSVFSVDPLGGGSTQGEAVSVRTYVRPYVRTSPLTQLVNISGSG